MASTANHPIALRTLSRNHRSTTITNCRIKVFINKLHKLRSTYFRRHIRTDIAKVGSHLHQSGLLLAKRLTFVEYSGVTRTGKKVLGHCWQKLASRILRGKQQTVQQTIRTRDHQRNNVQDQLSSHLVSGLVALRNQINMHEVIAQCINNLPLFGRTLLNNFG